MIMLFLWVILFVWVKLLHRDPVTAMVAVRPSLLREAFKDGNSNRDPVTVTVLG